ncbi:MAG: hypothetical protein AAGG07_12280 [Planctomycetota bacterium]
MSNEDEVRSTLDHLKAGGPRAKEAEAKILQLRQWPFLYGHDSLLIAFDTAREYEYEDLGDVIKHLFEAAQQFARMCYVFGHRDGENVDIRGVNAGHPVVARLVQVGDILSTIFEYLPRTTKPDGPDASPWDGLDTTGIDDLDSAELVVLIEQIRAALLHVYDENTNSKLGEELKVPRRALHTFATAAIAGEIPLDAAEIVWHPLPGATRSKSAGWTKGQVLEKTNPPVSPSTFDGYRKQSGVSPGPIGDRGHRFVRSELERIRDAAEQSTGAKANSLAKALVELLDDDSSSDAPR